MPRIISFLGSVALLISNITGPSLVVIPLLYQEAGWLTPFLTFSAIALLSGTAALFIVETLSSVEGNEGFQASIEFTMIAYLLGKRWHIVVQVLLYLVMQSLVIASLLEAFQSMDAFLIGVVHKACAVSFTDGWVCGKSYFSMHDVSLIWLSHISPSASSAFSGYILGSFGTLITLSLILPLSLVRLVDNIIFQVASFILLIIVTITLLVVFFVNGLDARSVPVVGRNQSNVVGFIISNFRFVMTIPAWVNNTHPSVNIRRAVWISVLIACLILIPIGWVGGLAFVFPNSATLLEVLVTSTGNGILSTVARVSSYIFPLAVLITSIPVFTLVIRYNLLRGNICSEPMAVFLSAIVPWLIVIPLQTNGALTKILNWSSLIFTSPANLLVPFFLFIVSKWRSASTLSGANVPGDPEMSLAPEKSNTAVESTPVNRATDSTAVGQESTEKEQITMKASEEPEPATESGSYTLRAPIMDGISSPPMLGNYEEEVRDGGALTGVSVTDGTGLYPAFPILSPTSSIRSTHISAVAILLAAALVLTGLVYNIMEAARGS